MAARSIDRTRRPRAGPALLADDLLGLVSDVVCRFDAECRHVFVSPNAAALGLGAPSGLIGRSHRELGLAEPFPSIWESLIRRVLQTREPSACDIASPHGDGQIWYGWQFVYSRINTGAAAEVIAVGRDISQQRRHQQRVQELTLNLERTVEKRTAQLFEAHRQLYAEVAERHRLEAVVRDRQHEIERIVRANLLSGMATGLAHELNQPLSAAQFGLSGCIRVFQGGGLDQADGIEALSAVLGQIRRAGEIVRHVLDLTRRHVPVPRAMDVEPILEEAAGLLRLEAYGSGVKVESHIEAPLPVTYADKVQVEQVIINLGRNAIDSIRRTGAGGVLSLRARATSTAVEVSVCDDGPGFAPDALAHLFEAFFTTKHDGVGLGLSICRSIIEETGGRISGENNPDVGACVRFTLPTQPRRP